MRFFVALFALILVPLAFGDVDLVVCPDKVSACPDGTTCCPLGQDTYGCCPIPNAVCCKDQRHCCPHDSVCDTQQGQCTQHSTGKTFPLHKKTPARKLSSDESESAEEGGLPIQWKPNSEFDEDSMKLESPTQNAVSPRREPFRSQSVGDVECADGKSKCPSGTTCCDLGSGMYGCCPVPNAVCCQDHLHCCPEGTQCDVAEGRCTNSETDETTSWYRKFSATKTVRKPAIELKDSSRPCNGGLCKGQESCCASRSIRSVPECCRFPDGVCCNDGTCCPSGYKCHSDGCQAVSYGIVVTAASAPIRRGSYSFDSSEEDADERITCPDNSECPSGNTCCPMDNERAEASTSYQCCPLGHATCCSSSCCPRGFHCASGNRCEKRALTKELLDEILFN